MFMGLLICALVRKLTVYRHLHGTLEIIFCIVDPSEKNSRTDSRPKLGANQAIMLISV
jgi:hypothetical protein